MIRVLIVTDNTSEWVAKIRQEIKVSLETINRGYHLIKSNSLFYFDIRQKAAGGTGPMIETHSYATFINMIKPKEETK